MYGPSIICRTLSESSISDKHGNSWQYYSRSDLHTKVACWSVLFDVLLHSPMLRRHAERNSVCFALNREMQDFWTGDRKTVDLALGAPGEDVAAQKAVSLKGLKDSYGIRLDPREEDLFEFLPDISASPVRNVQLAVDARTCMTGHAAALGRLQKDLCADHATIHGAADAAIAVSLIMVNAADEFVSPDRNKVRAEGQAPIVSRHKQPRDASRVCDCVCALPRRMDLDDVGYDALGVIALDGRNDGSPFSLVPPDAAPAVDDPFHYEAMVKSIAEAYEARFPAV